jgi:hypothetical protein
VYDIIVLKEVYKFNFNWYVDYIIVCELYVLKTNWWYGRYFFKNVLQSNRGNVILSNKIY